MKSQINRRDLLVGGTAFAGALTVSSQSLAANTPHVHDVTIKSFKFDPEHLVVKPGDIIRWTNQDLAPHTATAKELSWNTGKIAKKDSQTISVTEGMELKYFCAFHPNMKATLELA